MKRLLPTLILVLVCIGGFWYASSQDFFKEKPEQLPALVQVQSGDVERFTIQNGEAVTTLERQDGKWAMAMPSPLPLTSYGADAWVSSFVGLKKDKVVTADATDVSSFGLTEPKVKLTMQAAGGVEQVLEIGDKVPVGAAYYARLGGAGDVFQLSEGDYMSLVKQPLDFMDKNAVLVEYDKVRGLSVSWKDASWTLTKTEPDKSAFESKWTLGERELAGNEALGFLDRAASLLTDQLPRRAAEVQGLGQPELRLELKNAAEDSGESTVTYTGKVEGDLVWIVRAGSDWALAVPMASVQELADHAKEK
ncbi:DUF4340 domain-containing protein [Paenibacillus sp. YYML68]|uniref:DUF4340 domain-containing protein n=1 Tax=Paenibacillus sp. YYML68 TaxID=2909250 RepID=UPI00249369FD|nr:DUF4340 domain-containing protein [Paenibacillus sp. YYML68]